MVDTLTPEQRSERMARVRAKDTKPELVVRRLVHSMGYRYRLHRRDLPGRPDLVFATRNKVIFIHGCFWHRHVNCTLARLPKSRIEFWLAKLSANATRDALNESELRRRGWEVLTIWECELRDNARLSGLIKEFLDA